MADDWRLLDISYDSVYRNLALEEALVTCHGSECMADIRLWSNPPAIVVGRFQDIRLEADLSLCAREDIQIARRFTGGGTVFQDDGNLNFTIVQREPLIDLQKIQYRNISILKETLHQLGVESTIRPNSISVNDKKIVGASAAIKHNCVLWHASLLISTNITTINEVLSPSRESYQTKRVRSKWQPVTNLQTILSRPIEVNEVKDKILNTTEKMFDVPLRSTQPSEYEVNLTKRLFDVKYSTPEWNNEGIVK